MREIARLGRVPTSDIGLFALSVEGESRTSILNVLVHSQRFAYIIHRDEITLIVKFPANVVSCCTDTNVNITRLIAALSTGEVFAIQLPDEHMRNEGLTRSNKVKEDIFDDLRPKQQTLKPSTSERSRCLVIAVESNSKHKIVNIPNVCEILSIDSMIVALGSAPDGVTVQLCARSTGALDLCGTATEQFEIVKAQHIPCSTTLFFPRIFTNSQLTVSGKQRQLFVIVPASYKNSLWFESSPQRILRISDSLYNSLFGLALNLANSAVLLLALPGGAVHWFPLKNVGMNPVEQSKNILCVLEQELIGVFVCESFLEQASTITNGRTRSSSTLVFVADKGAVLCVASQASDRNLPVFCRYEICESVVCCAWHQGCLVYSTGLDLLSVDIQSQVLNSAEGEIVSRVESTSHEVQNIIALISTHSDPTNSRLYAVTASGRVLGLDINLNAAPPPFTHLTQGAGRGAFSSLLAGISRLSEEHADVTSRSARLNAVLQQLAVAGTIIANYHKRRARRVSSGDASLEAVTLALKFEADSYCFELTNTSGFVFGAGWKAVAVATFGTLSDDQCCATHAAVRSESASMDLESFAPNELKNVRFSFKAISDFPICVLLTLVLEVGCPEVTAVFGRCKPLVVPLGKSVFSVLNVLKPVPEAGAKLAPCEESGDFSKDLRRIAMLRRSQCFDATDETRDKFDTGAQFVSPKLYTVTVHILNAGIDTSATDSGAAVLQWILADSYPCRDIVGQLSHSVVRLITPDGHLIVMDSSCVEDDQLTTDVGLHGSNLCLLVQIRQAILTKIKSLNSITCVQALELNCKKKLKQLEKVGNTLVTLEEESNCLPAAVLHDKMFNAYEALRNVT